MHKANDHGAVADVVETTETDHGLAIEGRFDLDTEFGKSAYRNTKGRRVIRSEHRLREPQLHQDRRRKRIDRSTTRQSPTVCVYAVSFNAL